MTSALAISREFSTPAQAQGPARLTVGEAAARARISEQAIRDLCKTRWRFNGMAIPPGSGNWQWSIDPRADKRLMPPEYRRGEEIALAPGIATELSALQREKLPKEAAYLKQAEEAGRAGVRAGIGRCEAIKRFLERESRPGWSWSQFKAKSKAYRREGLAALADGRWTSRKERCADTRMLEEAARFYLDASAPSISECYRAAEQWAINEGCKVWKQGAVRKHIKALPPAEVTFKRHGLEAFKNKHEPYIQRTYASLKSNEIWQSDHMRFDVQCVLGTKLDRATGELVPQLGRPWLTTWIDVRSRKILAWEVRAADPDSGVIVKVFRRAALEYGIPESVYTDCGKDYDHHDFTGETKAERRERRRERPDEEAPLSGLFALIKIKHMHAEPYNARAKLVERMHRTIKEQFSRGWDTFTGGTTVEKPERLAEMVDKGAAPALEDFAAAFGEWVTLYNGRRHTGESMGAAPDEVYAANLEKKRTAVREELDLMLLRRIGPVKVGRNGVRYHGLYFGAYETGQWHGQDVYIRVDDADMSKVSVWDSEDKHFLCLARANRMVPANASRELLREAIREQKKASRALRNAQSARTHIHEDLPATMHRLEQERAERLARSRPVTSSPEPTIVPVRSAIKGELPKLQRALDALKPKTAEEKQKALLREAEWYEAIEAAAEEGEAKREAEREKRRENERLFMAACGPKDDEKAPTFEYHRPDYIPKEDQEETPRFTYQGIPIRKRRIGGDVAVPSLAAIGGAA